MNCVAIETVFATLITVAFSLLFRRSLSDIVTVIALLVPAMIPPICVNMALDALMPKLDWVTPQQLFKRGIFTLLFSFYLLYQWYHGGNCHLPSKQTSEY